MIDVILRSYAPERIFAPRKVVRKVESTTCVGDVYNQVTRVLPSGRGLRGGVTKGNKMTSTLHQSSDWSGCPTGPAKSQTTNRFLAPDEG
ncbi:hypothetical protein M404DRAFT_1004019, partial [Pisolithus tinctorius Marx 270]